MHKIITPQCRGRIGFARADMTPPVGIYHRLWGAATHERSTGVHRPLQATALWLAPEDGVDARVIIALDQCLLDAADMEVMRQRVREACPTGLAGVHMAVSHTHASGWMSRTRAAYPGGELIAPYLLHLTHIVADLALTAANAARPATIVFGQAHCPLARQRDFFDGRQYVCGFSPDGPADDTVVVARALADDGAPLGTLVNYACHPTTLAWENTLLSPDYVGAMRAVVEQVTQAPCLFLQGASGDLGPREGFTDDVGVADKNGRQLGFAVLAGLEALPPAGTAFEYAGPIVSGATLGIWKHRPTAVDSTWAWKSVSIGLPYREDLPTIDATLTAIATWEADERSARSANDLPRARDCRAHVERMRRQLARLRALPPGGEFPYRYTVGRAGGAYWLLMPGELYQVMQTSLRQRWPEAAVIVGTLCDDWQPGYLPTRASYGQGIYQETIAVIAPGGLETLIDSAVAELQQLTT